MSMRDVPYGGLVKKINVGFTALQPMDLSEMSSTVDHGGPEGSNVTHPTYFAGVVDRKLAGSVKVTYGPSKIPVDYGGVYEVPR
jgi:hypothetical protein